MSNRKHYICIIEGCGGKHESKGYCVSHYLKFKKYGDPLFIFTEVTYGV